MEHWMELTRDFVRRMKDEIGFYEQGLTTFDQFTCAVLQMILDTNSTVNTVHLLAEKWEGEKV